MRAHFLAGTFGLSMLLACASTTGDEAPTATEAPTLPAPGAAGGASEAAPQTPSDPAAGPDCSLAPLSASVADVSPVFVIEAPPGVVPPTMTGGALGGAYVVEKAKIFLPSASAGIVDVAGSKGRIASWAIFAGPRYRLFLDATFTIATSFGPQSQSVSTESQGGFTTSGAALKLDHECDTALTDEADYSFSDEGAGRATLLIRTPTPYGDVYLQLTARKD
jgi:hypothetical protein